MEVTPQTMRDTLRLWASGVAIVTTQFNEQHAGMTVSAFNSLSLEPPQILVCLLKETLTASLIHESRVFAMSILGADSAYLSDRFAGRVPLAEGEDRFNGVAAETAVTGARILTDAIGWLDCEVHAIYDGSTHWIVVGRVVATGSKEEAAPLIYYDRNYREIARQEQQV